MNNIYCYTFFTPCVPLAFILHTSQTLGHHKETLPAGDKSLSFPPPRITDRKLEQFQVSVSVAAASKVTFELTYEELLKRQLGKYELLIKVQPKQLVKHFQVSWAGSGAVFFGTAFIPSEKLVLISSLLPDRCAHLRAPGHSLLGDRQHIHDQ